MTEQLFCSVIENLRQQYAEDKKNGEIIAEAFSCEGFALYNTEKLVKAIFDMLHLFFPPDADGHCEITFYCFVHNFGKPSTDSETETPEMLYQRLTKSKTACI